MTERTPRARPPLVLIANSQEWHARSLESILGPCGYAVLRSYTGKQTLDLALSGHPDLILLDTDLPDRDGFEVCQELRSQAGVGPSTPILMTSSSHASRQKRLQALRAGAWDFLGSSLDGEELPLRLDAYIRAKREVDRTREESLLDELTGLYSIRGLARRARELSSQAFRHNEPFACIVLTPVRSEQTGAVTLPSTELLETLARALREAGRTSDAIGIVGPGEFAVVAQGTDAEGAERLAERLARATSAVVDDPNVRMAAGYDAVEHFRDSPVEPSDMLRRASMAMHQSRVEPFRDTFVNIRRFQTLPS